MLHIIPMPNDIAYDMGNKYVLSKNVTFSTTIKGKWTQEFIEFSGKLGFQMSEVSVGADITFVTVEMEKEEYSIVINEQGVTASFANSTGAQYSAVTIQQILLQCGGDLPYATIHDKPRYDYRGFMLDVGRFYYTVAEIKQFIDIMCLHKLNTFHWHITEDQGWRIEIKAYPLLTTKGQERSATNFIPKAESGFYTQDQVREVVAYCHDHNITVIPEIDMPGHMVAALSCYPELGCFDRKLNVATHFGVKHDILCVGKDSSYEFIYNVLDEVFDMFPDKYIHIGGDEVYKKRWQACPHCSGMKEQLGLSDYDELQAHFMNVINEYVKKHDRSSIMWNEHKITGKVREDIAWQVWGVDKSISDGLNANSHTGRKLINSSSHQNYLDFTYKMMSLKNAYCNHESLKGEIGIEAALWTEYVPNMRKAYFQTFPRLGAIAENAWTNTASHDYDSYVERMDDYYKLLTMMGVYNMAEAKDYAPSKMRAFFKQKWFDRRVFHWQGLHNIFDDYIFSVLDKKKYLKKNKNKTNNKTNNDVSK